MKTRFSSLKLIVAAFGLAAVIACKESSFSAGSRKTDAQKPSPGKSGKDGDDDEDADTGQRKRGGKDGKNGDGPDGGDGNGQDGADGDDVGTSDDAGPGNLGDNSELLGAGALDTIDDCLSKKADHYNILLIFDNSGSQKNTDPNAVRRDGALLFVDQFAKYVKRQPKAVVRFGVLAFNTASIRVGQGWLKAQDDQIQQIKDEITKATSNPDGGTAYSPVLKDAATYYAALSDGNRKIKNYVVFLTDGLPNAADAGKPLLGGGLGGLLGGGGAVETMADIPPAIDTLVSQYDVAMVAIATGEDIPPEGESITQSLAKPAVGTKDPKHVGVYHRARTTDELKQVWDGLFKSIGSCD
jgi:hypothetical protein